MNKYIIMILKVKHPQKGIYFQYQLSRNFKKVTPLKKNMHDDERSAINAALSDIKSRREKVIRFELYTYSGDCVCKIAIIAPLFYPVKAQLIKILKKGQTTKSSIRQNISSSNTRTI